MTVYEALKLCGVTIEILEKSGVKPCDYKYIPLFEDWQRTRSSGEKVSYIVACLAVKYHVSERTVYDVVRRLGQSCIPVSVK